MIGGGRNDPFPVGAEHDGVHPIGMSIELVDLPACCDIPDMYGVIIRSGSDSGPIWTECREVYTGSMSLEPSGFDLGVKADIPDMHGIIVGSGYDLLSSGLNAMEFT